MRQALHEAGMTTLAAMTLRVARLVTEVVEGTATAGTTTSLTDTGHLIQSNQYFDRGTLWILSGEHAGEVLTVESYAGSKLTFASIGATSIAIGDRYAVARATYPYPILVGSVNDALKETFVVEEAEDTYIGDGQTLVFELAEGANRICMVELEDPNNAQHTYPSSHWKERSGNLVFASGCAPLTDWIIHVYTRQDHPDLPNDTLLINAQISDEWLRWKATEYALYWAVGAYGDAKEYRVEERMNRAMAVLKTLRPRMPVFVLQSVA